MWNVGDEMCFVHTVVFVFLWDPTPWWLLFNDLMNKACRYSLIVTQSSDRHVLVKDNDIVDWGDQKGEQVRYIQVTVLYAGQLNSKYKGWFLGSCSATVIHRVTAIYRAVIYRFDCQYSALCLRVSFVLMQSEKVILSNFSKKKS